VGRVRQHLLLLPLVALLVGLTPLPAPAGAATPSTVPAPTVDPGAPTPTAPWPGGPPTGSAPDGSTVGGSGLHTRGVVRAAGAPALPDGVTAPGWLVADLGTGDVLAARDPHGRFYPASTLKTLTLLTLIHRVPADQVVTATADDEGVDGTRVGLVTGGQYPAGLLFQALILGSGNDAANALARAAGGTAATLAEMNATARALGAFDTVAGTPSGLDVAGQTSSPYDLALIFRALLADPAAAAVLVTPKMQIPPEMGRPGFEVDNENPLLAGYPGDVGGKNGFTDAARHTFVTAAERGGRRLVVSLMGVERQPGVSEYDQATRLLDWGFSVPAGTPGVGRLASVADVARLLAPAPPAAPSSAPRPRPVGATPGSGTAPLLTSAGVAAVLVVGVALLAVRLRRRRPPREG
jgi:D-alanyl-D-alanine carboxypeptidase (penicillin-binding protein 5/6)